MLRWMSDFRTNISYSISRNTEASTSCSWRQEIQVEDLIKTWKSQARMYNLKNLKLKKWFEKYEVVIFNQKWVLPRQSK